MSNSFETFYYDPGFRPELLDPDFTKADQIARFKRWGMTKPGMPVAMHENRKAAVWRGFCNHNNEAPALAVVVPLRADITTVLPVWYAGALAVELIQQAPSEEVAIFDAAEHGPYPLAVALDLLNQFVPLKAYPQPS